MRSIVTLKFGLSSCHRQEDIVAMEHVDLDAFSHGVDNIPNDKKPDAAELAKAFIRHLKNSKDIWLYGKIRVPVIVAIQGGCIRIAVDIL